MPLRASSFANQQTEVLEASNLINTDQIVNPFSSSPLYGNKQT